MSPSAATLKNSGIYGVQFKAKWSNNAGIKWDQLTTPIQTLFIVVTAVSIILSASACAFGHKQDKKLFNTFLRQVRRWIQQLTHPTRLWLSVIQNSTA